MPKKRHSTSFSKPSSSVHPSLSGRKEPPRGTKDAAPPSVNEKLQQLRLEQKASSSGGKSFEAPPSHTVHPSLRAILQIPEGPPPRPRPGLRVSGPRRAPPGPRAPESWLTRQSHEIKAVKGGRPEILNLPGYDLPRLGSVVDLTLKELARGWTFYAEYEQYYLPSLPVRLKELLLHYLAAESPQSIDRVSLSLLFQHDAELEGATGADGLVRLDLSRAIGAAVHLKDLKHFFTPEAAMSASASASDSAPVSERDAQSLSVPDDWDSSSAASLLGSFPSSLPRFHSVTHLSLACPARPPSWSSLLSLLPHLPPLTHLSLAYWPTPTLSPNSLTAYTSSPSGPVQYGSSHFYSQYDDDWSEAASIVRRVSRSTPALTWLDLTGNWPWVRSLAHAEADWMGTWAGLDVVIVGQGWVPEALVDAIGDSGPDGCWDPRALESALTMIDDPSERNAVQVWVENERALVGIETAVRERIRAATAAAAAAAEATKGEGESTLPAHADVMGEERVPRLSGGRRADYLDDWNQRTAARREEEKKRTTRVSVASMRTRQIRFEGGRLLRGVIPR